MQTPKILWVNISEQKVRNKDCLILLAISVSSQFIMKYINMFSCKCQLINLIEYQRRENKRSSQLQQEQEM